MEMIATAVASFAADRVDIFALGTDNGMYHKAWNGSAWVPETDWDALGGEFSSAPAVVSWGNNRLDIFALGTNNAMYHMFWAAGPRPRRQMVGRSWAAFSAARPPSLRMRPTASMFSRAARETTPCITRRGMAAHGSRKPIGTTLAARSAARLRSASWGNNRLDIFAIGTDNAMHHFVWAGGAWIPPPTGWENLGGVFNSPPAVASWGKQ